MFKKAKVALASTVLELSDLPRVPGSEVVKSATVTEWDVMPDIYANTIDPETGEHMLAPITKVSRHTGLTMYDVTTGVSKAYRNMITASDDHSLITYNPTTLKLEKTTPVDSLGRCVPVMRYNKGNDTDNCIRNVVMPSGVQPLNYDMGMLLGILIGDGWISESSTNCFTAFVACDEPSLQQFIIDLSMKPNLPFTKQAALYAYKSSEGRFSSRDMQRITLYIDSSDAKELQDMIGHGAGNKRIPPACLAAPRKHLLGILMGLLATDGSVSHNPPTGRKKSADKHIAYHTTSVILRDGVQQLGRRLGVRTSVTTYTGTTSGNTAYMINFSLEDMVNLYQHNPEHAIIPVDYKQEAYMRIVNDILDNAKASNKNKSNSYTIVPFPRGLFCEFSWAGIVDLAKDQVISARAKGFIKRSTALRIAAAMERRDWSIYKDPSYLKKADQTGRTPEQAKAAVDAWIALVRDENTDWAVVEDVTPSTCTEGWDCTVPGPYTFALSDGTVVQDTVNIHAPVSRGAVRDIKDKMMP